MTPFETDNVGNLILKPVTGWAVTHAAEIAVLLRIEYLDSPADTEKDSKAMQFALTPPQALELAEKLTKRARRLLDDKLPPGKAPN